MSFKTISLDKASPCVAKVVNALYLNNMWKDIPGYEGLYQINKSGEVKSLPRISRSPVKWAPHRLLKSDEKILKHNTDKYGYKVVTLRKNKRPKTFKVHRLVLLAFVGPNESPCNHINGDKADNRLINLEYCSVAKNNHHKMTKLGHGKLTKNDVIEIFHSPLSSGELAQKYKVHYRHIWAIKKRIKWKSLTAKL